MLRVSLDPEQEAILRSVQFNPRTSVSSGTARGKDYVSAVAGICFLYLTPRWNDKGELIENTKVAMTAPTGRQVENIMYPEISRIFNTAKYLPGRLTGCDIRTNYEEWFLTGFKADEHNHEAWSGFHAANTMFIVTEASGIPENVFTAIEGNLQGNSRILIVFNPNVTVGYAASSQFSTRWNTFRLDSLSAPNVLQKKIIFPGQVDYEWVKDKVDVWCEKVSEIDYKPDDGDFEFDGELYRPNDRFRVKVRGMFPKEGEDVLVPLTWIEAANKRWHNWKEKGSIIPGPLRYGIDVAGMGRDSSVFCSRYGNVVTEFTEHQSAGKADHMRVAGDITNKIGFLPIEGDITNQILANTPRAFIDTIGEGAGVYSRLIELGHPNAFSVKFSEAANDLTDMTGVYKFRNMRGYLLWAIRDALNPANGATLCLPPCPKLTEELREIRWWFKSDGSIEVESKDDIKVRIKRSTDYTDSLANTYYPHDRINSNHTTKSLTKYFF